MSLFSRSIRLQSSKIPSLWGCAHSSRSIATASIPLDGGATPDILTPRGFAFPSLFPSINLNFPFNNNVGAIAITTDTPSLPSIGATLIEDTLQSLLDMSTWFIKRTYQPSIIRKRRKHGFLRRKKSVGGRRVLARRKAKGRARLGGS